MSHTLIDNIGLLVTNDPSFDGSPLGLIENAAIVIESGSITWVGRSGEFSRGDVDNSVDALGRCIIPGFVDSHTHMIFAGDRGAEFRARMQGESYSAGGIKQTVELTRAASNDDLLTNARRLFSEAMSSGTTTMECKSGYGLTVEDEARSLAVARQLTEETTFLGAHVIPKEFVNSPDDYVDLVCGQMLDSVLPHAKWIDVFCDRGAFNVDQALQKKTASLMSRF